MAIDNGRGKARLSSTDTIANKSAEQAILRKLDLITFWSQGVIALGEYNALFAEILASPESFDLEFISTAVDAVNGAQGGTGTFDIALNTGHGIVAGDFVGIIAGTAGVQLARVLSSAANTMRISVPIYDLGDNNDIAIFRPRTGAGPYNFVTLIN